MRIRLLDDNLPARLNELAGIHGAGTLRRMPAGAAHGPQGLDLCGSSSTDTILYIHTVFHRRRNTAKRSCGRAAHFPSDGPKPLFAPLKAPTGQVKNARNKTGSASFY
ncbi:hypothetical protein D5R55_23250 [Burkholderia cenocepacia]|uniref:Uncharacterized protein n=1 Tax=Burkholderia cenocepacia TaxID=95486 RepID=A0A3Q9FB83_9BURK|nr:hypothetical protein D5R55_23250 [Burkholderia cenocepacia]